MITKKCICIKNHGKFRFKQDEFYDYMESKDGYCVIMSDNIPFIFKISDDCPYLENKIKSPGVKNSHINYSIFSEYFMDLMDRRSIQIDRVID